jgi:hypothetical protein
MLLVRSSWPFRTILHGRCLDEQVKRCKTKNGRHDETDGKHEATQNLDEPGVGGIKPGGTCGHKFGKEVSERE